MKDSINVLMVVPNLRVSNGVASFAMSYYRALDHNKIHMDFATYNNIESPYINEINNNGDKVYVIPFMKHYFDHTKKCKEIIALKEYDIIHDNSLMVTYPLMRIAKNKIRVRILHSHSARLGETSKKEKRNKFFMPLLLNTVNVYAACSTKAGNAIFPNKNMHIIPNAVDADRFKFNSSIREAVRKKENCFNKTIIGTVGRLTDAKNPFFAFDVMNQVLDSEKDFEYWWIGSGVLDKEIKDYVYKLKNKDRIKLFGSRSDIEQLYQAMDLFFLPSKSEGFGLACVEAEASGLTCIVSDALPTDVNITGNVIFIPLSSSFNVWCDAIISNAKTDLDRNSGFNSLNNSSYSLSNCGKKLEELYFTLLNNMSENY